MNWKGCERDQTRLLNINTPEYPGGIEESLPSPLSAEPIMIPKFVAFELHVQPIICNLTSLY
jgi:hypothetical protein